MSSRPDSPRVLKEWADVIHHRPLLACNFSRDLPALVSEPQLDGAASAGMRAPLVVAMKRELISSRKSLLGPRSSRRYPRLQLSHSLFRTIPANVRGS